MHCSNCGIQVTEGASFCQAVGGIIQKCGALDINCDKEGRNTPMRPSWRTLRQSHPQF